MTVYYSLITVIWQAHHLDSLAPSLLLGIKKVLDLVKHMKYHQNECKSYFPKQVLSFLYGKQLCLLFAIRKHTKQRNKTNENLDKDLAFIYK